MNGGRGGTRRCSLSSSRCRCRDVGLTRATDGCNRGLGFGTVEEVVLHDGLALVLVGVELRAAERAVLGRVPRELVLAGRTRALETKVDWTAIARSAFGWTGSGTRRRTSKSSLGNVRIAKVVRRFGIVEDGVGGTAGVDEVVVDLGDRGRKTSTGSRVGTFEASEFTFVVKEVDTELGDTIETVDESFGKSVLEGDLGAVKT